MSKQSVESLIEQLSSVYISLFDAKKGSTRKEVEAKVKSEDVQKKLASVTSNFLNSLPKPKSSGKSKVKDPNAPKRAKSSYIFFCQEAREKLKGSEVKSKDVMSELGSLWKALPEKKKKKYEEMAEKDKERYKTEMKSYSPPSDEELEALNVKKKGSSGGKKGKKDPKAPKGVRTAYNLFSSEMRAKLKEEDPEMGTEDVRKKITELWKVDYKDEEDRKKWNDEAKQDKVRHDKEMADYNGDLSDVPEEEDSDVPKKKSKTVKLVKAVKPVKCKDSDDEDEEDSD